MYLMKTKTIFILGLLMLFTLTSVQAGPIVELSVDDTWEYTGAETYDYTVIDKQDFANGEEYVELIKIETNEIIDVVNPYLNVTDASEKNVILDLQATFTSEVSRWHTARGNFLAILEKAGTFTLNTTIIMNVTLERTDYYDTGTVTYKRYYVNFDLQSPIVTGNPIYVDRITCWDFYPINLTLIDVTTYRIDGSNEWISNYKGTDTAVKNVTIDPHERTITFLYYDYGIGAYDIPFSVDGMKQYLWVFANDIGLPIYKETTTLSLSPLALTSLNIEKYDLTAFSVALSNFEFTRRTSWALFSILGLFAFYFIRRRR